MTDNASGTPVPPHMSIFKAALPMQVALQELGRSLGATDGLSCLNVGDEGGIYGAHLRARGGEWATCVADDAQARLAREFIEEDVEVLESGKLPYEDKSFDIVVLIHALEGIRDDLAFVGECHRVMKNNGRLVLVAGHLKTYTLIYPLERLLGISPERLKLARAGYTEPEVFSLLKDGFDVKQVRTFSRAWVSLVDTFVRSSAGKPLRPERMPRAVRAYRTGGFFYRLAYQLDLLLFWTRGFNMICEAKRRAWLPRKTPVLSDGRSISEAVLSRMAG